MSVALGVRPMAKVGHVTFRLEKELVELANEMSKRLGISRSELLRRALTKFLIELNDLLKISESKKG